MNRGVLAVLAFCALAACARAEDYPCESGDSACYCSNKNKTGMFADTKAGCAKYYWCVSDIQTFHMDCAPGTVFNNAIGVCDWPANVQCGAVPSPTPTPSPTPSPTPTESPTPSSPRKMLSSPPPLMVADPEPVPGSEQPGPSPSGGGHPHPVLGGSNPSSCSVGDATCMCEIYGSGMHAEPRNACSTYYTCVSSSQGYYQSCPPNLFFSDVSQSCNFAAQVSCGGVTPTPTPSPGSSPPPSPFVQPPPRPAGDQAYDYSVYYESWADPWAGSGSTSKISQIPTYANYVILSFMKPDSSYNGGVTFDGTGLQFSSSAQVVKDAVAALKQANPKTKVLVAVGGATYTNWNGLNADSIVNFVKAFGLDGVDIDFEPSSNSCGLSGGQMKCSTDSQYISIINSFRSALPRPYILSSAVWSTGAYGGPGAWQNATPTGTMNGGMAIQPLTQAGSNLDMINIMSYDAGPWSTYDPKTALEAYSSYFHGRVLVGMEVAPEQWGGHVISLSEVDSLAAYVVTRRTAGLMLWSAHKKAASGTPTANQISQQVCNNFSLSGCSSPLV